MGNLQALRLLMAFSVIFTVLPMPSASAQAADWFPWTYMAEDADIDEAAQCAVVWDGNTDGGCDLLRFSAGNDETMFYFQFNTGTMDFPNPGFAVFLRVVLEGADGTVMIAQGRVGSSDFAAGGTTCTPEGPSVPNLTWTLDRPASALMGSFPLASFEGAVPGSELQVVAVASRLAVGAANNYVVTCGAADTIPDLLPYTVTGITAGGGTDMPTYVNVTTPDFSLDEAKEAFTGAVVYNWTTDLTRATVNYTVEPTAGNVTLTIVDGSNTSVASDMLNGSEEVPLQSLVPGNWTVRLDYANFTGSITLSIAAPPEIVPDVVPDTNATDNTTAELSTKGKDSPGLGLPLLLTVLALFVAVVRRK